MSTELLSQIDMLEQACHAALRKGDDAQTIALLLRALTTVTFTVSKGERPIIRGLANLASTHSGMLLDALKAAEPAAVVHKGLTRVCNSLAELREALEDDHTPEHRTVS